MQFFGPRLTAPGSTTKPPWGVISGPRPGPMGAATGAGATVNPLNVLLEAIAAAAGDRPELESPHHAPRVAMDPGVMGGHEPFRPAPVAMGVSVPMRVSTQGGGYAHDQAQADGGLRGGTGARYDSVSRGGGGYAEDHHPDEGRGDRWEQWQREMARKRATVEAVEPPRGNRFGPHYIGIYSPSSRRKRLERFWEKRKQRVWKKKTEYDVRKVRGGG
jgi:hypothetical protein